MFDIDKNKDYNSSPLPFPDPELNEESVREDNFTPIDEDENLEKKTRTKIIILR